MSVPHVLVDQNGFVLLDTGFPGDGRRIQRAIARLGGGPRDVRAILLTHGHIDFPDATRLRWRFEELCEECERRRRSRVL